MWTTEGDMRSGDWLLTEEEEGLAGCWKDRGVHTEGDGSHQKAVRRDKMPLGF